MSRRQRVRADSSYKQASLLSFYPTSKRRQSNASPVIRKRIKVRDVTEAQGLWCSLPTEMMCHVLEYLSFSEGGQTIRVVCRDWYFAWCSLMQSIEYWRVISSQRHSSADLDSMIHRVPTQPHVAALKEFFEQSNAESCFAIKHLYKNLRLHSETQPVPKINELFRVFRIKHSRQFGDLGLVKSIAMAQVCLKSSKSLYELGLENCSNLDLSVVKAICRCTQLRRLNLSYSGFVGDDQLKAICRQAKHLEVLILQGLPLLTTEGLGEIGRTSLKQLDLSHNLRVITDDVEFSRAINSVRLTHLLLDRVELRESALSLLSEQVYLDMMSLANCHFLDDSCLDQIADKCPRLRLLSLSFSCVTLCMFSETGVLRLIRSLKCLKAIALPGHLETSEVISDLEKLKILRI